MACGLSLGRRQNDVAAGIYNTINCWGGEVRKHSA